MTKRLRVAINGFGRIGRNIFRVLYERDDIDIAAICDVADAAHLVYLLKHDTLVGRFEAPVSLIQAEDVAGSDHDHLVSKGRMIPFIVPKNRADAAPGKVDWRRYDVDVVIEASGRQYKRDDLEKHLTAGARRVVLTVTSREALDGTYVRGVNDSKITADHKIVSVGSLGMNALAPVLKVLDDAFGIADGFYTLVHAYTNEQTLGDVYKPQDLSADDAPGDDLRRLRSAPENIIPASTKNPLKMGRVLPNIDERVGGMALSAAVPDGSVVDLVTYHECPLSVAQVNEVIRNASQGQYKGMLYYATAEIVSADVTEQPYSAIFDSKMTKVMDDPQGPRRSMVKSLVWYDNGWAHAYRVVDLIEKLGATL